ncbi:MAG: response regulator [Gammaproteobacteria bacterium]|nr:response regulator [Gammaproteobacteria bacterium]
MQNQSLEMQANTSVLVVEDDSSTRERFSRVISGHPQLDLVGDAGDLATGIELLHSLKPDILLMDLDLPDGNGMSLIEEIVSAKLDTEAMVISVFGDERHVIRAIEAGAGGYLLKDGGADQITNAILQLVAGGAPISPSIARHLLKRFRNNEEPETEVSDKQQMEPLTTREQEILNFVSYGYTAQEIAKQNSISIHTVNTHIRNIYGKLAVNSRAEAIMKAVRHGIIKTEN